MITLRKARLEDHLFLVKTDLKEEGYTSDHTEMTDQELAEHKEKILSFLTNENKGAYIVEEESNNQQIAMIMFRISHRDSVNPDSIFDELDRTLFQKDGRFLEIFQLWVHPQYRKMGLATKLKLKLEEEAVSRGINLVYTHTEETNKIVLHLNERLGYKEVRKGPIWDDVIRVSLIKQL